MSKRHQELEAQIKAQMKELFKPRTSMLSKWRLLTTLQAPFLKRKESSGLVPQSPSPTPNVPPTKNDWDSLFCPMFDEYFNPSPSVVQPVLVAVVQEPVVSTGTPSSTRIDQDTPSTSTSQTTQEEQSHVIPTGVEEDDHEPSSEESSSRIVIPTNVHSVNQPQEHIEKWTKDHPLDKIIGDPSRPVSTRLQLQTEALFCYYDALLSSSEYKSYKDAITKSCWIDAMKSSMSLNIWRFGSLQIKEQKENGVVELYFVGTEFQLADIFSKPLGQEKLEFLMKKVGMQSMSPKTLKKLADETKELWWILGSALPTSQSSTSVGYAKSSHESHIRKDWLFQGISSRLKLYKDAKLAMLKPSKSTTFLIEVQVTRIWFLLSQRLPEIDSDGTLERGASREIDGADSDEFCSSGRAERDGLSSVWLFSREESETRLSSREAEVVGVGENWMGVEGVCMECGVKRVLVDGVLVVGFGCGWWGGYCWDLGWGVDFRDVVRFGEGIGGLGGELEIGG
ncbi:hypothetical protein Tco_0449007 [Tanacetum coccineum]